MDDNIITCSVCSKLYKSIKYYNNHIRFNRCNPVKTKFSCKFCIKTFTRNHNKSVHETKCIKNPITALTGQVKTLKLKIKEVETSKLNIYNNNTLVSGNVTNNIVINNFGSEDISHITDKQYLQLIGLCKGSIPKLIEDTHFNPSVPENINVYKSNFKDKMVKILVNNRWNIEDENVVLRELYMKKGELLEEKFEELKAFLSETLKTRFQWFLDNREEEEMMNEIIGYIKKLLYNKRDMIYRTC